MESGPFAGWLAQRTEVVLACAEEYALSRARSSRQRQILETAMRGLRQQALAREVLPAIHLPLLVYACLQGDDTPAVPLAAATSLLFLGVDIIDDLADGDRPAHWEGYRAEEISLAGSVLVCALPQLALAELTAAPARVVAMQQALAQGLLTMAAGQQADLAYTGAQEITAEAVEASVAAKSGGEFALFTTLAAHYGGATDDLVDVYARLGQAFGTGSQVASSCVDLFEDLYSRDLAAGTRTLPIAYHLERLTGAERTAFLGLLDRARTEPAAQAAVRAALRAAGVVRRCAVVAALYRQRALRALAEAQAQEPGRSGLHTLIDRLSFSPARAMS